MVGMPGSQHRPDLYSAALALKAITFASHVLSAAAAPPASVGCFGS